MKTSRKMRRSQSSPADVYCKEVQILFLGAAKVGKSSLVRNLLGKNFVEEYIPTVYDVYSKEINCDNGRYRLEITDMSGYYSFPPMRRLAISNSSIFVLVYEMGNKKSYAEAGRLKEEILQIKNADEIAIILIGNKCDAVSPNLIRDVEVEDSVTSGSFRCLNVSAKSSGCMDLLLDSLLRANNQVTNANTIKLTNSRKKIRVNSKTAVK
eukprot:gene15735-17320_t